MARLRRMQLPLRWAITVIMALAAILVPALAVSAAPTTSWRAEYYNNVSLTGAPVLVRDEPSVNYDWGTGAPAGGVNADNFSVNWTTFAYFAEGTYTFHLTVDDGVRMWIDDALVVDEWRDQPVTTFHHTRYLGAGYHSLRVSYYERTGFAVCRLSWDAGGTGITEWRGEYYNNTTLSGAPLVRNDASISFDWGTGVPAAGIGADNFSVRWTRDVNFPTSGTWTFSATVDDGVRLWVDGAIVIDRWYPQSRTTHTGTKSLTAGAHNVRVEYFEQTGDAVCIVSWSVGGGSTGPEIIVDDLDPGFIWGGPTSSWYARATGFRGHLFWTWNASWTPRNWAKWFPYVSQPGNYEVYVYVASRYFGTKSAKYKVILNGTQYPRTVNQNNYYNQWVSLGTYYFGGGAGEYVYLSDATGESYATRYVGFDAVKFVRRDGGGAPPPPPPPPPPMGCSITPIMGFGTVWNSNATVRSRLGCPTDVEKGVWAGEQTFVGGYMFWRQDAAYIYVMNNNGTWQGYADTWTSAEPEWDTGIVPPPGYFQPKRGFGKVWRNNPSVRSALSWGTMEERGFGATVQAYTGGIMLWSSVRGVYVLYNDGTWQRF